MVPVNYGLHTFSILNTLYSNARGYVEAATATIAINHCHKDDLQWGLPHITYIIIFIFIYIFHAMEAMRWWHWQHWVSDHYMWCTRPRIPIERWLIVWAAKKTNTRNGRCVAYTRAMFNKWYIVMHGMCFDDDFQFKTNKEKTAINTEIMRAFRVPRVRCDGCDGWWCGMHFVPSVPIPLCHMPQWQWHIPACFRVQYIWCGCWAACWMLLILKSLSKRMRQHIRAHRMKMMRSTKMVRIKFLALWLYCAQ